MNLLRLRLAFGYAGRQPDQTSKLRLLQLKNTILNGAPSTLLSITNLGNTQLSPERSGEVEGGFDAELWRNRLSVGVTYAQTQLNDAIINIPVAPSVLGGGSIQRNIGQVRKHDTEIMVDAVVVDRRALGWNVHVAFSRSTNILTKLRGDAEDLLTYAPGDGTRYVEGYPLGGVWSKPIISYADANGNGRIDNISELRIGDTAVYAGAPYPNFTTDASTEFTFWNGRIRTSATISYTNGTLQTAGALYDNSFLSFINPNNVSLYQQAIAAASLNTVLIRRASTNIGAMQRINTLRFNELSVAWQAPPTIGRRFGVNNLSVALQGRNLGLKTNYVGKDPDVNGFVTGNALVDSGQLPQPREWRLSITLGN
jgi:hypothetical protein